MSGIILTDDPTVSVARTFLDDSYHRDDPYSPVIVARIPAGADLRWHDDVVAQLAPRYRELKAARVLAHLGDLSADLQRAVKRTIRDACISILDPRVYTFQFEQLLSRVGGRNESSAKAHIRQKFMSSFVRDKVLWHSPAWRIQQMLFPEPLFDLSQVYGVSSVYDVDESLFDVLKKKLQKPHAIRVFGARSAAAFAELLDPAERMRVLHDIAADQRYFFWQDVDATVFLRHRSVPQMFDEGERTSVEAIELLREHADEAVQRNPRMRWVLGESAEVAEGASHLNPALQAADVAAGYARRLYESNDGLKKVCIEFRQVLLNGTLIRDWQQQEPIR